ncbi:MAG: dihydroneopterin aldolase [Akkermansiaceae bacterium]
MKRDTIEINRLEVDTYIGVPDEERSEAQKLWISLVLKPSQMMIGLHDDIANTIDYHEVSIKVTKIADSRPRRLIETLATEVADDLLSQYPLLSVQVRIEKKILPNADFVAVTIERNNSR